MTKNILIGFLFIALVVVGLFFIGQNKKLDRAEELNANYLIFQDHKVMGLTDEILYEIDDEILNEGKLDNKPLIDTINFIQNAHQAILKMEGLIPLDSVRKYDRRLRAMVFFYVNGPYNDEPKYIYPATRWKDYQSPASRKSRMMELEIFTLDVLFSMLGSTHCWGGVHTIELWQTADTINMGPIDTLSLNIGLYWNYYKEEHIKLFPYEKFRYEASIGEIVVKSDGYYWKIYPEDIKGESFVTATISTKEKPFKSIESTTKVIRVVP